ncbi:MAG: hypothetical protein ACKVZ6_12785 [Kineosporiaceae bacterium]|jgi:hypothetical protein
MPAEPRGAEPAVGPPAWGTPDPLPARRRAPAPVASGEGFVLLVEQTIGSTGDLRWATYEPSVVQPTRDAARRAALDLCRRLDPSHPFSEQRRSVYRISDDEYLVVVVGRTKTFHFRVSVAERLA